MDSATRGSSDAMPQVCASHTSTSRLLTTQWDRVVFRDYLGGHQHAAFEYGQLERDLAGRFSDDRALYAPAKTAFIQEVLARVPSEGLTRASTQTARLVR